MPFYKVNRIMQYTEVVYVEANSKNEAKLKSGEMDGERIYDDHWYDSEVYEIDEEEYNEKNI